MPRQTSSRSTPRTTPAPANEDRKPNGRRTTGNGGNDKPTSAWPVELVLAAEVELSIEGKDASVDGFRGGWRLIAGGKVGVAQASVSGSLRGRNDRGSLTPLGLVVGAVGELVAEPLQQADVGWA